jgi:hypothetical protein
MFAGCTGLRGAIPADMFYFSSAAGKSPAKTLTSLEGLFYCCYSLTLNKYLTGDKQNETEPVANDGFKSCFGVKNASGKEVPVGLSRGGNYRTIYPCALPDDTKQTDTAVVYYGGSAADNGTPIYFVPQDWLKYLTNLTNVSKLFSNVGVLRYFDAADGENKPIEDGTYLSLIGKDSTYFSCIYELLQIPSQLFNSQGLITKANELFSHCKTIGATVLTKDLFTWSLSNLSHISKIFEYCILSGVNYDSFGTITRKNNTLKDITRAFYRLNFNNDGMSNYLLSYGDIKTLFRFDSGSDTPVNLSDLTGGFNAPNFWDNSIFSKIDSATTAYTFSGFTWDNKDIPGKYKTELYDVPSIAFTKEWAAAISGAYSL